MGERNISSVRDQGGPILDPAYIVAEIGSNHQGDVELCKDMITAAAQAGADGVKLQKRDNKNLYTRAFYKQPYNSENAFGPTYGEHREALELSFTDYQRLAEHATAAGVVLFATAFDIASVEFLESFDFPFIKIASCDITNHDLLRVAASSSMHVICSTGAATQDEMDQAYDILKGNVTLLHCVATYPNAYSDLNLQMIPVMKLRYPQARIGVSLHTNGPAMGLCARALGAEMIEMHFTTDRTLKGADQAFSLEPQGLSFLVENVRRFEEGYGDGIKRVLPAELPALEKMGKSCVASSFLPAGVKLKASDIAFRTPGGGIPPSRVGELLGQVLGREYEEDEQFRL